ncbi:MAG: tetratricopeptide repeat protein [Armatimonadetes bacterium]|nr:tetratricopeptide repeat protein [Armatimonadota bacterium]
MASEPINLSPAFLARSSGDRLYEKGDYKSARSHFESLVEKNKGSKDPDVQDQVGIARLRLGYIASKEGDFQEARTIFVQAAEEYKGRGFGTQYGTLPEQADYQAAVCLQAGGSLSKARQAYLDFIKENQLSPLVHSAYSRLVRLNGGKPSAKYEKLIQSAISAREAHVRKQMAICGPKAVREVLARHKLRLPGLDEISKLCGTDDSGTSMAGMIKALKAQGLGATGLSLAFEDLETLPLPAIWLEAGHFLVITKVHGKSAEVYDPVDDSLSMRELPSANLDNYILNVIKIERELK